MGAQKLKGARIYHFTRYAKIWGARNGGREIYRGAKIKGSKVENLYRKHINLKKKTEYAFLWSYIYRKDFFGGDFIHFEVFSLLFFQSWPGSFLWWCIVI